MSDWGAVGADNWDDDEMDAAPCAACATSDTDLELLLSRVDVGKMNKLSKPNKPPQSHMPAPPPAAPSGIDEEPPVELGFVSPYPGGTAEAWHFPSKVGGKPVWLLPTQLPSDLSCASCGRTMRFVLQLYCPRPEVAQAYHRSLMLFCCGGKCLRTSAGWRALRCKLPQDTPWYVEEPDGSWTARGRESIPAAGAAATAGAPNGPELSPLPELLISVDVEGDWRALLAEADARSQVEARRLLTAYEASESEAGRGEASRPLTARAAEGATDEDSLAADEEDVEDSFYAFQRRASAYPEQSLRYNRDPAGVPLWAGTSGRRTEPPPPCARCGAARTFECQVMPQLLCDLDAHGLDDDATLTAALEPTSEALDWGVVVLYTCSASCATVGQDGCGYADEFVWHQPL